MAALVEILIHSCFRTFGKKVEAIVNIIKKSWLKILYLVVEKNKNEVVNGNNIFLLIKNGHIPELF